MNFFSDINFGRKSIFDSFINILPRFCVFGTINNLRVSCNIKKSVDHHGVHLLKKKSDQLIVSQTNKNDIIKLLGPPSVVSIFDNDYTFVEGERTWNGGSWTN